MKACILKRYALDQWSTPIAVPDPPRRPPPEGCVAERGMRRRRQMTGQRTLDGNPRVPKYYQVKKQLLELIEAMPAGNPVPPEDPEGGGSIPILPLLAGLGGIAYKRRRLSRAASR
jgi:hypothetical protein